MATTREKWQKITPPDAHADKIYFLNTNPKCRIRFLVLQLEKETKEVEEEEDLYRIRIYAVFSGLIGNASQFLGIPSELSEGFVENPIGENEDEELREDIDAIHRIFELKDFGDQGFYNYIKGNLDDEKDAVKFLNLLNCAVEEVDQKTINDIQDLIKIFLEDEFIEEANKQLEQGQDDVAWKKVVALEQQGYYELTWQITEAQFQYLDRNALIDRYTHISQNNPVHADEALERLINFYGEEKDTAAMQQEKTYKILEKQFTLAMMMKKKNSTLISRLFNEMSGKPLSADFIDITTTEGLIELAREIRGKLKAKPTPSTTGVFAAGAATAPLATTGQMEAEEPAEIKTEPTADKMDYRKRPRDESIDDETRDPNPKRKKK